MRGGRNKFGPMYKRDRARKLQVLRQRQVVLHHSPSSHLGGGVTLYGGGANSGQLSSTGGNSSSSSMYTSPLHIKQEIQIPQVTSMTSSPDSSPSPVHLPQNIMSSSAAAGGNQAAGGSGGQGQVLAQQTDPGTGGLQWQISTSPQAGKVGTTTLTLRFLFTQKSGKSKMTKMFKK